MMTRQITNIGIVLSSRMVTVSSIVAFNEFSLIKHYELSDDALVAWAENKNLDTWAEPEVCELLDQEFPLPDPMTQDSVVTTYVGQS